jgi:hypothetical protein
MHMMLYRTYDASGVNGELYIDAALECYTIELPWLNNRPNRSCIPEGTYVLKERYSPRHGRHLEVTGVKGRSFILIHSANNALAELRGCIAPVTQLTGPGRGVLSRMAFERMSTKVFAALKRRHVLLSITHRRV